MSRKLDFGALILVAVLGAACSGGADEMQTTVPPAGGAASAVEAVDELVAAIGKADFEDAGRLAVPSQSALASLSEQATFSEIADALRNGDRNVAANFWSGFAQGSGDFLTESVTAESDGTIDQGDLQFHTVVVTVPNGSRRSILVRDVDGFRIDIFASFGAGLAERMRPQVERLLAAGTDDSRLILGELTDIVPSLLVAAELPGTTAEVSQQILALVELITRVG